MWKNALATVAVRRSGHTTAGIIRGRPGVSSGRASLALYRALLVRVCEGPHQPGVNSGARLLFCSSRNFFIVFNARACVRVRL